jgi:hypothetical protein
MVIDAYLKQCANFDGVKVTVPTLFDYTFFIHDGAAVGRAVHANVHRRLADCIDQGLIEPAEHRAIIIYQRWATR